LYDYSFNNQDVLKHIGNNEYSYSRAIGLTEKELKFADFSQTSCEKEKSWIEIEVHSLYVS
jgi:hypothetical protein